MKTVVGNLWDIEADFRGIPTNGYVTKAGDAVMGRGVALQAKERFHGLEGILGMAISNYGNKVHFFGPRLFSFPVKHHWRMPASVELIRQSVQELKNVAERLPTQTFAIPLVGTGNGRLAPEVVWPLLSELPDNVTVVVLDQNMMVQKS